ncbi:type II toxin-antitoxin system PemK/MazF family toxin [Gordonia sp. (in: high G+C Gram-positive bacteria)]|uniref:type II toxin-antitoxin system PemK/MazF family toxin n=1 Tax=Gordonia sp. (in: high G+C Gram-positive bacteria) TaxID=84139 RepID=UPI0039E369B9
MPHRTGPGSSPTADLARAISYRPDPDGDADPGEVVWTWVPFEEDATKGKDRPVLVVGRDTRPDRVLGLMLSSQAYHADEPNWRPIGAGVWDEEHRPSYVRLDRVLVIVADHIRREGAVLDRQRFDAVADELRRDYGWR